MPDQNVVITGGNTPVATKAEPGNPAGGFATLTPGTNGQIKGTSGDDKATLATVLADKDQIINLGDGNDVFIFRNNAEGSNGGINGLVSGGDGFDHVFFNGQMSDYIFTIRSNGGIKAHYTPDGDDGAAVTFNGWESFTFRGVDTDGVNHQDLTLTYEQLYKAIQHPDVQILV